MTGISFSSSPPPTMPWLTTKSGGFIEGSSQLNTTLPANGLLKLTPFIISKPCAFQAVGAEFTVAGDVPSLFNMAIYADDGTGFPGALVSNPGSISTGTGNAGTVPTAGTPGVYFATGLNIPLSPGVYWWGGAVQGVTVTAPTMRTGVVNQGFIPASNIAPLPGGSILGYQMSGVTAAPPANFQNFLAASTVFSCPRMVGEFA